MPISLCGANQSRRYEFALRRRFRVDQPAVGPFNGERGEDSAAVCAGIDPNAIGEQFGRHRDGVTVHHHETVVAVVVKKRLADPAQVALCLLLKLDTGPDPGMNEQIVSKPAAIDETLKERDMLLRDRLPD